MLEYEKRLDNTIPSGHFHDGADVEVRTKMGSVVSAGQVMSVMPWGLIVRESTGATTFYAENLYLFASLNEDPPTVVQNQLLDMSLDARVQEKLVAMGEAGDPTPSDTGAKPIDPDATDDEYKDKDGEKNKGGDSDDKKDDKDPDDKDKKKKKDAVVDPESAIDTDKLPDDIKGAIISTKDMDEGQLNGVLSDISDAALKALKRTGVSESEIFELVQKISDSSFEVLTGKKMAKKKSK